MGGAALAGDGDALNLLGHHDLLARGVNHVRWVIGSGNLDFLLFLASSKSLPGRGGLDSNTGRGSRNGGTSGNLDEATARDGRLVDLAHDVVLPFHDDSPRSPEREDRSPTQRNVEAGTLHICTSPVSRKDASGPIGHQASQGIPCKRGTNNNTGRILAGTPLNEHPRPYKRGKVTT